ncbi:MAG: response regulator transcription factor [Chloroflexi bacterium]|nr:response regulator transcription factor [Chloroflexota bacterium]
MDKLRVLIADDHAIVREGFRSLLEAQPDLQVVGEAADGEEAVRQTKELRPDIVLMDITMPVMDGLEATRQIKKSAPEVKVLVLTMHEGEEFFFKLLDAGASGYFVKGGSSGELIWALRSVAKGDVFLYPTVAKRLLSGYLQRVHEGENKEAYNGLSPREREILKLIAEGRTNQEIAELLVLSPATVHSHRSHIMAKLGLRNPVELVRYALRRGLIDLDS